MCGIPLCWSKRGVIVVISKTRAVCEGTVADINSFASGMSGNSDGRRLKIIRCSTSLGTSGGPNSKIVAHAEMAMPCGFYVSAGLGVKRQAAPPLATPPCEAGPPSWQGVVSSRSNRQSASIESLEQNRVSAGKSDLCSSWSAERRERKTRTWLHGHRWAPPASCLDGSQ